MTLHPHGRKNQVKDTMAGDWRKSSLYLVVKPYVPDSFRRVFGSVKRRLISTFAAHRVIDFGCFKMRVSNRENGGIAHETMYWHELGNPLSTEIVNRLKPALFVDVGANYGFASLLHHAIYPDARMILIEPNPNLLPYIESNLRAAGCADFQLVNAVCGDSHDQKVSFAVNAAYSQDSRVSGPSGWQTVQVASVTLDGLMHGVATDMPVFIKVDTQGYEAKVLQGAQHFLSSSSAWIMKIEFGPLWLKSQGTDPVSLLRSLLNQFVVAELPSRMRFQGDDLDSLLTHPLKPEDSERFEHFVRNLANGDGGYCDLLVLPRTSQFLSLSTQVNA